MFCLLGIFCIVVFYFILKVQVCDFVVIFDLDEIYINGLLVISVDICNFGKKVVKGYQMVYILYVNKLYLDENILVVNVVVLVIVNLVNLNEIVEVEKVIMNVQFFNKWLVEFFYFYIFVVELKDKKGKIIEIVLIIVGFCKVEIKDIFVFVDEFGLVGCYYYVNGKIVKLKGVNCYELNLVVGYVIICEMMEKEVMLMKCVNINYVCNFYYLDDLYWYYLCNKYGFYLEDEVNIEFYEYYYGVVFLFYLVEWKNVYVVCVMEMVYVNVNNFLIVIWLLGNEVGLGKNFIVVYDVLKVFDFLCFVQYECNNDIVDMGFNQYFFIGWMCGVVKGNYDIKYLFYVLEYVYFMGNVCGNLVDYWEVIELINFFCGGVIWDWVD